MNTLILVCLCWGLACLLLWQWQSRCDAWQQQCQRYGHQPAQPKRARPRPHWHQQMVTMVGQEQLTRWTWQGPAGAALTCVLLAANGMPLWLAVLLAAGGALALGLVLYQQLQQRALEQFRTRLPEVIDGMIRALRVGAPLADIFLLVARQQRGLMSRLFAQMHDELQVGQPVAQVMQQAAGRVAVAEFQFLTIVLSLQQETGGRLSEVLAQLVETLRARQTLAASIQTITAESRNAAKVLAALPVIILLVLFTTGREHFTYLMTTTSGQWVLGYVSISVAVGLWLIRRLTRLQG
ncbi:TPA: pilus assembly protein TadB [Aeromonas hydrophila]|jgi:tight adherence protein B|uniref:Flp fimbrial biogenesis protein FlpG n=1 Tax=Aeromonas hydrophila TaxID=644 RepID=UPI000C347F75|nr:Flp fimbrial biogenesis protein FlpG [Aeromonas hydrophila]PKD23521.1 Flp pilus assembly protein TadB [Aeromonas hydrophila]WRK90261.1 Flp fimbrial biogenesis protein FlpG [Aeromonas hydrophila]HAT2711709.1 pilus assembly protein TadB [Aeromonas hydrophila]